MSLRAFWQPSLLLTLLAFLAGGCERRSPTGTEAEPAVPILRELAGGWSASQATDERQEILKRYEDELWPCPQEYRPILIDEYVASTPPLKAPGDPDYWDECSTAPGHFTNHNSSTGTAAHLGTFVNEWDSCLDVIHGVGFFDAQLTAANGDQLNWEITATATPRPGGGLHFETTNITFAGGTGRFADATGYAGGAGNAIPGEGENYYYAGCLAY